MLLCGPADRCTERPVELGRQPDRRHAGSRRVRADNQVEPRRQGSKAGTNEMPQLASYRHLVGLVRSGALKESIIDRAVRRVLRAKFALKLFDEPYVDATEAERKTFDHGRGSFTQGWSGTFDQLAEYLAGTANQV